MTNKKLILGIILSIFLVSVVSAQGVSYCCEKTTEGAWCINAPSENCDVGNNCVGDKCRATPTSCEATAYCKLGCCYDSQEGTCMENTPQKVCENSNGIWEGNAQCEIPQCQLGCCLIGDQAAFVTQTKCKRLSSLYGVKINFMSNIKNEIQCIASATSDEKGACVFEKEFEKTCDFLTKKECQEMRTLAGYSNVNFHQGYLCSAETLGTNCGPTEKTICVEEKDEVYFVDSCGNLANIYDASKIKNKEYWSKIYDKLGSCGSDSSNAGSAVCGNCDYYLGSTCKSYQRGEDKAKPKYGDNICRDLSCEYGGKKYQHGETWCATSKGVKDNLPGSRHFRLVCYNGEVSVEPCADFRQEVCAQSDINGFKTASCRVNEWQFCVSQDNKRDCENSDKRDCSWISGERFDGEKRVKEDEQGSCVPKYFPGFDFWNSESATEIKAKTICSSASTQCIVTYEKGLFGEWKVKGDKTCLDNNRNIISKWEDGMNQRCVSLGDCGSSVNYIGVEGYNNESAIKIE